MQLLILRTLEKLLHNQEIQMSTPPVTRAQFDSALSNLTTVITTSFTDLQAKIASGQITTPEDFSAELAEVQADIAAATSNDPGPQTPQPTPTPAS